MKTTRLLSAIAALAMLGACATATPYQAAQDGAKGYANQQIENDRWQVTFAGNSLTDRQTVETYLLYRAAELTKQQGFDHFRVVQRETEADRKLVPTGFGADPFYSNFHCNYRFYGRRGLHTRPLLLSSRHRGFSSPFLHNDPFWGGYDYREIVRYEASSEIIMGRGPKPNDPAYFNADEVVINLAGRIQRPEV